VSDSSKKAALVAAAPVLNPYDMNEIATFKKEVQGGGLRSVFQVDGNTYSGGVEDGEEDDEEAGPAPMVQPKQYSDDKKVLLQ
jgi:hypothetical protein